MQKLKPSVKQPQNNMESKQDVLAQAKEQRSTNWLSMLVDFAVGIFRTTPAEKQASKAIKIDNKVAKVAADGVINKLELQQKIDKRIAKARKAISVTKLKEGKLIYVQYYDEEGEPEPNKRKEIFTGYTDDFVKTDAGEHVYTNIFNWHGRPVLGPEIEA